jgi:hypothetical protein
MQTHTDWNSSRFKPEDPSGFYESYFQRANHPTRPLAFWIRYTSFIPRGRPDKACGELWAIYFDGETNRITAVKDTVPISQCSFSRTQLDVCINGATLTDGALHGRAVSPSHIFQWSLRFTGHEPPLLLLPESLYEGGFPKAKSLVGTPNADYTGTFTVDGREIPIDGWRGSQNHNWGSRHTDRYAWGQVAGFDNAPDAFLECCTAQVKLGPVWSPRLTFVVLRDEGQEIALNGLLQAVRASGNFDFFNWTIDAQSPHARIYGRIHAPAAVFVGLRYQNPPGGRKTCLNTKLASAEIIVERRGQPPRTLKTMHRAAFEILTDRADHGVAIVV